MIRNAIIDAHKKLSVISVAIILTISTAGATPLLFSERAYSEPIAGAEAPPEAPSVPSLLFPIDFEDSKTYHKTGFSFSWNESTDETGPITYKIELSTSLERDNKGNFTNPVAGYPQQTSATSTSSGSLSDGTYYWHVNATDSAINQSTSEWSETWEVRVDNTVPAVTINSPEQSAAIESNSTLIIGGSATEANLQAVTILIENESGEDISPAYPAQTTNNFQFSWDTKGVDSGTYKITVMATDKAGNTGTDTREVSLKSPSDEATGGVTDTGTPPVTAPTVTTLPPPVSDVLPGLAATPFNTSSAQTLGVTAAEPSTATPQPEEKEEVKAANTTAPKEKETIAQTSSKAGWWIVLITMAVIAAYYGYRNWQLDKEQND